MDVSRTITEGYKIWLALGGVTLIVLWRSLPRDRALQALWALTILSCMNYARWGFESTFERLDAYDLMHYYINAKYFDELGYLDLYPAVILADHDNDGPFFEEGDRYLAQNEQGHQVAHISHAVSRGKEVRDQMFTPERWEQFEHDVLYLQREKWGGGDLLWRQMIQDHGFNGTPVWTLLARPIASVVAVEDLKLLGFADLGFLAIAVGAIAWAYGSTTALWTVFFLTVSYSMRWPTVTWVFLRYDWMCGLLIAMALLKKGHHFWAGLFAGYSAALRFFPALWMWGPGLKGVSRLVRREVQRKLLVFAGGFLVAVAILQGGAMATMGPSQVITHFDNMMDHNSAAQLSSRRIGLALAMTADGKVLPKLLTPERRAAIDRQKPLRLGLAGLFMLVMGWGLRRADDDEAYGYGFLPFFLLTTASYYYYVARATLAVVHAADLDKTRNQVGLGMLFGLEVFSNWAETVYPGHRMFLIGWLSWGLCAYALFVCGAMLLHSHRAERQAA